MPIQAARVPRPDLAVIEQKVIGVVAEQLGLDVKEVTLDSRLVQDLNFDSLGFMEVAMGLEDEFDINFDSGTVDPTAVKGVFTRNPLRVRDLAEMVYLQWDTVKPISKGWILKSRKPQEAPVAPPSSVIFSQLSGRYPGQNADETLFDDALMSTQNVKVYRRRTDGMRCIELPDAVVRIGYDGPGAQPDESDLHNAWITSFLIDAEPVSTTAYARFLNSIGPIPDATLNEWFILNPDDRRQSHQVLTLTSTGWQPAPGTQTFPMILVSWFGAHAYARWANGASWSDYKNGSPFGFLPTEAQWEYAARGPHPHAYPWGNAVPSSALLQAGLHEPGQTYAAPADLPMSPVNALLGMTATGLHHMAGNVWQWCADWYDPAFYRSPDAYKNNPVNNTPTGVRSERGGSWVGPASLARSSYRRARAPHARGRCLGFRCVSAILVSK
jgi:formylglycine-generating enzyme